MDKLEKIRLSQIDDFNNHPFKVNNDDSLKELANSIKENGLCMIHRKTFIKDDWLKNT